MKSDRERRIGTLAVQAGLINADQLGQALGVWSADQASSMGAVLESLGWIDAAGRVELERLAAQADSQAGDSAPNSRADSSWRSGGSAPSVSAEAPASSPPPDEFATLAPGQSTPPAEPASSGHVRLASLDDPSAGAARTRYSRTQFHARGGIGQVWLARDGDLGREVALKELRPEQGASPDAWSRFVAEARITGQLEHPGIVPVYELSVNPEGGDPFYTMRFIRGKTLNKAIRDYHEKRTLGQAGPLDLASLLTAFVALCNTVGYAHSRGVIHRDLKGQNVVLGDFGEVMLLDWGIAKLVGQRDAAGAASALGETNEPPEGTLQGQVFGTPFYMAPEQAEGRINAIDARTDVYGLGAILYEILVGKAPYEGYETVEVLRRVSEEAPVAPRLVNSGVARGLEAICLRAMAKRPDDRYPTALVLADEVQRWLADEPIVAYREPALVRVARWAKRHRSAVASGAALLLMAVVALAVSSVLIGRERDEARRQRHQARQAVDESYTQVADGWLADRLDPLQRAFLAKALAYYRDFAGPDEGDATLRQERGRAYLRMGDVLRKLGQNDEAEPAYRRSIAIFAPLAAADPGNPAQRDLLAEANYRLGLERAARVGKAELDEAARLYREAAATQAATLAEAPSTARRVALGRTLNATAHLLRVTGQSDEAEATYRRSITTLEPAVAADPGAVAARQELGLALDGLGNFLKDRGRIEEAQAPVRQAVGLFEPIVAEAPTLPTPRDNLARAYNTLGLLLRDAGTPAESEAILAREAALNRRLAEDYPARPEYRRTLARALINLGIILRETNRLREADTAYSEALKLNEKLATEFPEVRNYARDQARCLSNLAELRAARKLNVEPLYRQALKINQALADAAPDVVEHRIAAAGVLQNLGTWQFENGRGAEAVATLHQAVDRFEALALADAANPGIRRGLARTWNALGGAYASTRQPAEAEDAYRRATNAFDLLVSRPPVTAADRLELATCLSNRGTNQTEAKLPGSEESLRRSLALLDELGKEGPPTPDLRVRLAAARSNLGDWLAAANQPEAAETAYREAVDLFTALHGEFPDNLFYTSTLGQARANMGEFLVKQHRPDDGQPLLERGIGEERAALAAGPDTRLTLRKHLAALAALRLDRRAYAEVVRITDEMLKLTEAGARPADPSEVARLLARCVPLAAADNALPASRRSIVAGDCADRAIALLREAIATGTPDADRLLADPTFDPIRTRDGFKALQPAKVG